MRQAFYTAVLCPGNGGVEFFRDYLFSLYYPAIYDDIEYMLSGRYLDNNSIQRLAMVGTGGFIDCYIRNLQQEQSPSKPTIHLGNIVHDLLFLGLDHEASGRRRPLL